MVRPSTSGVAGRWQHRVWLCEKVMLVKLSEFFVEFAR